jgi:two-component system response regulator HydG
MATEIILIVDPEAHTQWTLKTLLESEGYNVITANTIDSARKKISNIELSSLITEYWVNHSSTLGVIRDFKKLFPEAYVMMLANGEVQENEYREVLDAGVDDFFLKPFSSKKILLHLRKGLNHHQTLVQKKGLNEEPSRSLPTNSSTLGT